MTDPHLLRICPTPKMRTVSRLLLAFVYVLILSAGACKTVSNVPAANRTSTPSLIVFPKIDRKPFSNSFTIKARAVPTYDPDSDKPIQVDLRSNDLSELDLSRSLRDLSYATFDTNTRWPSLDHLPAGFDWVQIMEFGKNPGLGIRSLHALGITGRDIGIGIIDQVLLVEHQEYADRLELYEEINTDAFATPQMHGSAVASIAAGRTVGVAPEARIYYIAANRIPRVGSSKPDLAFTASAIRRLLEINRQLSSSNRMRVISISLGWMPGDTGYAEIMAAVEEAKSMGVLVLSSNVEQIYGYPLQGLGRVPLADPDRFESYEPGLFWARQFPAWGENSLFIPMDSRTFAGYTGRDQYAFFRSGGWSWIVPYLAGVYALAAQIDPSITPGRFFAAAMQTGRMISYSKAGLTAPLGPILDPVALVQTIGRR